MQGGTRVEHVIYGGMVRRTRSKAKTLEAVFPIRVHVRYASTALPGLLEAIEIWGVANLGRGRLATVVRATSGVKEWTLYFRSIDEAKQCFEAFDELELRDWVGQTDLEREPHDYGLFNDLRR